MAKWQRGTGSGYQGIYNAFNRLRRTGVELQHPGDLGAVDNVLDYVETIVTDDDLWRRLPDKIEGVSTVGMRADLEGILSECARPKSPED